LRLRLVEQAAVIRHLELQLAAVTSETGAATASRYIASTVADAVSSRQSNSNTSNNNSKSSANKKYTATTAGADTGSSDDINGKLHKVRLLLACTCVAVPVYEFNAGSCTAVVQLAHGTETNAQ
jgi:hypothetical protein